MIDQPRITRRRHVREAMVLLTLSMALLTSACTGLVSSQSVESVSPMSVAPPPPPPTPVAIGDDEKTALENSVLAIQDVGDESTIGSAVVLTADGFLITDQRHLSGDARIKGGAGKLYRPVLVTQDPATNLAVIKIPAENLDPITLSDHVPNKGDTVYVAGYDGQPAEFGQLPTQIKKIVTDDTNRTEGQRVIDMIEVDLRYTKSLSGAALSDNAGTLLGVISDQVQSEDESSPLAVAVSKADIGSWLENWHQQNADMIDNSADWPILAAPDGTSVRYPDGWATPTTEGKGDRFRAEVLPADPDAPLQLTVSIEGYDGTPDPMAFAKENFGGEGSAEIWGEIEVDQQPGVRLRLRQEGALVDIAYIFDGERMIAVALTSGYSQSENPDQFEQISTIFDTVINSLSIDTSNRNS